MATGTCLLISLGLVAGYVGLWLRLVCDVQHYPPAAIGGSYLLIFALPVAGVALLITLALWIGRRRGAATTVVVTTAGAAAFIWTGAAAAVGIWLARQ